MFGNGDGNSDNRDVRLKHPDLPFLTHAILVFMVGIGVVFFFGQMVRGIQFRIVLLLSFVSIPLWACYMFQFDLSRTFFVRLPGWRSWIGLLIGAAGMFILLHVLESLFWSYPPLSPPQDRINDFRQRMQDLLRLDPWKLILLLSVATPICEEVLFRGFFLRSVRESSTAYVSILLTGVFFGVLHPPLKIQMILMSLFGIYLGAVVWMSGSIVNSILIHALHNTAVLVASDFSMSDVRPESFFDQLPFLQQIVVAVTLVSLILFSLYLFHADDREKKRGSPPGENLYKLFS